ncbi:PP0621 family protein [Thiomicrorhabdus hydrogeniphila]
MRAIVFLLFIILVYFIARFTLNRIIEIREKQRQEALKQEQKDNPEQEEQPQEMVRCAQCGVHLPQAEAYYDGKDTFCSEGHMNQYHQEHNQEK